MVTVEGTTLEEAMKQPNGGGLNSSLAAETVTVSPLMPGQSVNLQFLFNVAQPGGYRFFVNVEAATEAPASDSQSAQSKAGASRPKAGKSKSER